MIEHVTESTSVWALTITTFLGFLGMIVQQHYAAKKAERDIKAAEVKAQQERLWDLEDRRLKAETDALDRKAKAEEVSMKMRQSAEVTRIQADRHTQELKAKIDENTEISSKAFAEANNVNAKLEQLGERITERGNGKL